MTIFSDGDLDEHKARNDKKRISVTDWARSVTFIGRDIGDIPACPDPERKANAIFSLQFFLDAYFPKRFTLPWCDDHRRVIQRLDDVVKIGGLFALAMPRGGGKTSLIECACLWAVLGGYHAFVALLSATKDAAVESMDSIKTELEVNDLLFEDWAEVCLPVRMLEGITLRAKGQLCCGQRTKIGWGVDEMVLPTIQGSRASGAIFRTAGIMGRIRGMKFTRPDGVTVRPSLVMIDDPQTDMSAYSLMQCDKREKIITATVLGLTEPGKKIAAICPCTVIRPGDVADNLLNRDRNPAWQGERMKMIYQFPTNLAMWDEYADMRASELRNNGNGAIATKYYEDNRAVMEEGARVAWPDRYEPDELSALQSAMNLYYRDKFAFFAEYQNDPIIKDSDERQLNPKELLTKVNSYPHLAIPLAATKLTAFVDIQQRLLYYCVVAWIDNFTGYVIDYGSYPDQQRPYFTLLDSHKTISLAAPGAGLEGSIHAGLTSLCHRLLSGTFTREDGAQMPLDKLLIDASWGASTDTVYDWCRQNNQYGAIISPSHGRYVGAASKPWGEYVKKPGEKLGFHWLITTNLAKRAARHVLIDTNFWKTFVSERLHTGIGDKGSLTFYGKPGTDHRMIVDHCCSEFKIKTSGRGRDIDEWRIRPERNDNHFWDCLVGATAAASIAGCTLVLGKQEREQKKPRVSYAAMQQRAANGR